MVFPLLLDKKGAGVSDDAGAGAGAASDPIVLPSTDQLFEFFAGDGLSVPALVDADGDGQPVTTWTDKVASYAPTQGVLTSKPTYHINGFGANSRASIEFDGGDYLLATLASSILAEVGDFALYMVYLTTDVTTNVAMYEEAKSDSGTPLLIARMNSTTADRIAAFARDDASTSVNPLMNAATANDGNPHLYVFDRNANNWTMYLDGVAGGPSAGALGAATMDRMSIGALITGGSGFTGELALLAAYSNPRDASIATIINDYYGIS